MKRLTEGHRQRSNTRKLTRFRRGIWLSVSSRAMSIRTHFCVVFSQLGWPVIKGGKPTWNQDPHQGFDGERRSRSLRMESGIPSWAEATYSKLLEHPAHAQPSHVVVVVPTGKDRDGILQEAVLQCFLVSEDTVSLPLPPHLAVSLQPSVERKPAPCCRWSCSLSTTSASFSKSTQKLHCGRLGVRW